MLKEFIWYLKKLCNLGFLSLQLLVYTIFHPKRTFHGLWVPMVQLINEYHQETHSRLLDFSTTQAFQQISRETIFSMSNVFNLDFTVTRPIESQVLSALVRHFQPKTIFEIGTYFGFTTLHMAYNSPADCVLYSLDLPLGYDQTDRDKVEQYAYSDFLVLRLSMKSQGKRQYKGTREEAKIRELYGNSKEFDFSPYHGKMDFILIDGNHSYSYVKSDTEAAFRMLSPGGILLWHDFDFLIHRDIFNYLNELSQTYKIYFIPKTRFAIFGKTLE